MDLTVRTLGSHEWPLAAKFLNEFWAPGHIYARSRPLFDWTFGSSDLWDRPGYSFAAAEEGDEVVGILGAIPFTFQAYGHPSLGLWLANWMVRPEWRATFAGMGLLNTFRRPPFSTLVSFGINPEVARIYRVLRWSLLPDFPRTFFLLPEARERFEALVAAAHPAVEAATLRDLSRAFQAVPGPAPTLNGLDLARWEAEDWPRLAARRVGAARDRRFLTWRYLQHPLFTYRILGVEEGGAQGLLVWRREVIRQRGPNGDRDLEVWGRIVELLPTSAANARALLSALTEDLRAEGALGADWYGTHAETAAWAAAAGLLPVDTHPAGRLIPARCQPLDGKAVQLMSALTCTAGSPLTSPDWYWTRADSDQDRPN